MHFCENCIGQGCVNKDGEPFYENTYQVGSQCFRVKKDHLWVLEHPEFIQNCLHPKQHHQYCIDRGIIFEESCTASKKQYCDRPGNFSIPIS